MCCSGNPKPGAEATALVASQYPGISCSLGLILWITMATKVSQLIPSRAPVISRSGNENRWSCSTLHSTATAKGRCPNTIRFLLINHVSKISSLESMVHFKGVKSLPSVSLQAQEVALEQAAQGGGGVSVFGDIQDPPGQGPVQPAVGDPALAGGLD